MRPRQGSLEIFSTFPQFEGDRATTWASDSRLRRSMQRLLKPSQSDSSHFWALYWYKVWQETAAAEAGIAVDHLTAYLQETCYWSAQKTMTNFALAQHTLPDCFRVAIAKVKKVLQGFDPQ